MDNMTNTSLIFRQSRSLVNYLTIHSPPIVAQFYSWGYVILFILGFTGNIASLLTFTRSTLRSVSTGTLFIVLAISDLCFLFASIFDFIDFGLQIPLSGHIDYDSLCRYRVFAISMSQICSAWVLVIISIDRWIRTRFPHKSRTMCTPKRFLIGVALLIICDISIHSPMITPSLFGMLLPGVALVACGPNVKDIFYLNFYFFTWTILQIFINCIVPVILMLLILVDMSISINIRKHALHRQMNLQNQTIRNDRRFQRQLFFLMISSIIIFLITTLPLAIYRIVFPNQIVNMTQNQYGLVMDISAGLTWFWGFNYCMNFYIHCLTSKLFRKEFLNLINKFLPRRNQLIVVPITNTKITHFNQK